MSVTLGLKRVYRCWFEPRRLIRQLYVPAFVYILGWSTAAYRYAGPAEHEHISNVSFWGILILLILKVWAGKFQPSDWFFQNEDGAWQRCSA
jgi:hypothetical protein